MSVLRPFIPGRFRRDKPIVPVVRLTGVIGFSTPLRPGLSLAGLARTLDKAFATKNAPAVALAINSPGGSPVQSHLIFRRIRELAAEHKRRVIAFVEDAGASGGYMIACAGDEIIADPHSIVGSIGVVGGSFGFDKLIAKVGDRTPPLYVGRAQGLARSVPAGRPQRRRTPEEVAARHP